MNAGIRTVGAAMVVCVACGVASGHATLEVFIGRTAGNQLAIRTEPLADEAVHVARSVFPNLMGYATPGIGFESLAADMPGDGLFVLSASAQISVRIVGADAGLTVYDGFSAIPVGGSLVMGAVPFDNHPLFNIAGPGVGPGLEYGVRLIARDASGQYEDSEEFTILVTPACSADIDLSGVVGVQDVFDFLTMFFQNLPGADFNRVGGVTVQDIFDFLGAFFSGCD